ncbi:MAG: DUF3592 domain-containing protein [Prosthecobacter sp.]
MPSHASKPLKSSKKSGSGCAVLFGLPFLLGGLAVGWFLYFPVLGDWWSARGWDEVPCWIEEASLKASHGDEGGTTHQALATYRYKYRGRTFHSDKVSFYGGSDNIGDFQQRAHEQIRAHQGGAKPFRCYVNPVHPEQAVLFRDLRWGLMLLMSIFPLIFPLVGFIVSYAGFTGSRKSALIEKLTAQHPDEPWRWRPEWAGESIQSSGDALTAYLVAGVWILFVQAPLALAIIFNGTLVVEPLASLALLPSLLAWIPLSAAWKRLKARLAFGRPSLQLAQTPVRPGQLLDGELRFDRVLSPRAVIQAKLLCESRRTQRSDGNTSVVNEELWEHTVLLSAGEARREITGVALPLRVEIPRGLPCEVIGSESSGERHEWTLQLTSAGGGKPALLPLPVFITPEEAQLAEADPSYAKEAVTPTTEQLVERLKFRGIHAEFDTDGIPTLIDSPPGQSRAAALFLILFGTLWFAIFIVLVKQDAPWIFRLVWGLTSPLILGMGLWTLIYGRRVEITPDELRITTRLASFYSWRETYAPRHIISFSSGTSAQSGNQSHYRIVAETTFGKKHTLVGGITESLTAETLAKRLEGWKKRG